MERELEMAKRCVSEEKLVKTACLKRSMLAEMGGYNVRWVGIMTFMKGHEMWWNGNDVSGR